MSWHAGEELGALASITAAIEATRTDITDIRIEIQERVCHGQIRLVIPLNDVTRLEDTHVTTDQVRIAENELQIDLDVEIEIAEKTASDGPKSTTRERSGDEEEAESETVNDTPENRPEQGSSSTAVRAGESDEAAGTNEAHDRASSAGSRSAETPSEDEKSGANEARPGHRNPRYQDPEQLAAVYDEGSTFEEMRESLGVDVTAQTVRKYMIKYGIHEPDPRPDRMLESLRASEFELMTSGDERQNQTKPSDDADSSDR